MQFDSKVCKLVISQSLMHFKLEKKWASVLIIAVTSTHVFIVIYRGHKLVIVAFCLFFCLITYKRAFRTLLIVCGHQLRILAHLIRGNFFLHFDFFGSCQA